jgi:hypothetical protein
MAQTDASKLPEDMIAKISEAVQAVITASGYGEVVIVVEKGVPRWIKPSPSIPLTIPGQRQV